MHSIELLRNSIEGNYFTDADVINVLGAGAHFRLSRLVKKGYLFRIRRGLFVFNEKWRSGYLNKFSLSNIVYGPSYVSLESALSHYGLIPEGVYAVIAVNAKRTKKFETPVGLFLYRKVPQNSFESGVVSLEESKNHFLIATPERAVIDKIYLDYSGTANNIREYLEESIRIERYALRNLRFNIMLDIVRSLGNKKTYSCVTELFRLTR